MKSKLDVFKEQELEKQRETLMHMLDPFKERSAVFAKVLTKVQQATSSITLIPIMERMLQISDNIKTKKKEEWVQKLSGYQEKIKRIHEQEISETEEDLDKMLDKALEGV